MINLKIIIGIFFCQAFSLTYSQTLTQTIRGIILDKESKIPLSGAFIQLYSDTLLNNISDQDGYFKINGVPLGRQKIELTYFGYYPVILADIIIGSAKEVVLKIEMEQSVHHLEEVIISGDNNSKANEMASVSFKVFSVNETERYAGSRGDPARMASNFAGVQGSDDSRNDIIIRGNSPLGLLWRFNDIDIPNPNHFAIPGATGGAVSILNNKVLANSNFLTGAFPAEYGNAIAGVFDLKMRAGNNEKHEFTGQLGFLGTELTAEGPISKNTKSSYLFNYRYSSLSLFSKLNIPIGTSAVPRYQDMSFNFNFPTKKHGTISLFGIGGKSNINIILSNKPPTKEIYGEQDKDQYFSSGMGVVGIKHTYSISSNTFSNFTISYSNQTTHAFHEKFWKNENLVLDSIKPQLGYNFIQRKGTISYSLTRKVNLKNTIKTGFIIDEYFFDFKDSIFRENEFQKRLNYNGQALLLQPYIQDRFLIRENLAINLGLHAQYFFLNNSHSIEPRAGLRYKITTNQSLNFGYGLHSQMQPMYTYFYQRKQWNGNYLMINKNMGFSRSHHFVIGYDRSFAKNFKIRIESYYQYLFKIPITYYPSSFSLINQGSIFSRFFPDSLTNKGTGENYGVEFTLEKSFSNHYYFMFTSSIYNSKYKGSDGIKRNTDFNGNFAINVLGGSEFLLGKKQRTIFINGFKITWAGGRSYGPVDLVKSKNADEVVYLDQTRNSQKFKNYFRTDIKIGFKRNNKKVVHEISLDLINIFGTKNLLGVIYDPDPRDPSANPLREQYQLGFLPLFYYRVDF